MCGGLQVAKGVAGPGAAEGGPTDGGLGGDGVSCEMPVMVEVRAPPLMAAIQGPPGVMQAPVRPSQRSLVVRPWRRRPMAEVLVPSVRRR